MNANQVLLGAAKRIEEKGWCQGSYGRMAETVTATANGRAVPAGSPCGAAGNLMFIPVAETDMIGALRQTGKDEPSVDEAKAKLRRHLRVKNLADWNDDADRTKEDVVAALKAAAKS